MSNPTKIQIQIDKIVLTGFGNVDRDKIIHNIQNDLAMMFKNKDFQLEQRRAMSEIKIPPIVVDPMQKNMIGKKVAISIYDSLNFGQSKTNVTS